MNLPRLKARGVQHGGIDSFGEAIHAFESVSEDRPSEEIAVCYHDLGCAYTLVKEYEKALGSYDSACKRYLQLFRDEPSLQMAKCCYKISLVCTYMDLRKEAENILVDGIELVNRLDGDGVDELMAKFRILLTKVQKSLGKEEKAERNLGELHCVSAIQTKVNTLPEQGGT